MHQRTSAASRRPSGTDGSDFSYRMVVDSRYQKVAKGKSRLSKIIFIQAIVQLIIAASTFLAAAKTETLDGCAFSSVALGFISIISGELGRKRSRSNFLKFYVLGSSAAIILPAACFARSHNLLEVVQNFNSMLPPNLEVVKITATILGFVIQIFSIATTVSLIHNMAPPKRAS
nr:protein jagunal homolog 1-like [Ipomoea batatas]GMD92792.1 protein jagunal homolog 1-like [Ipomoea batatas]GME08213.1 protein jagunal homolog 1-like [Ipomoea batatas]